MCLFWYLASLHPSLFEILASVWGKANPLFSSEIGCSDRFWVMHGPTKHMIFFWGGLSLIT